LPLGGQIGEAAESLVDEGVDVAAGRAAGLGLGG
jgi:hypothetical protein